MLDQLIDNKAIAGHPAIVAIDRDLIRMARADRPNDNAIMRFEPFNSFLRRQTAARPA